MAISTGSAETNDNCTCIDRRKTLRYLAGASAITILGSAGHATAREPPRTQSLPPPQIIDIHHHYFPPFWLKHAKAWLGGTTATANRVMGWSPQRSIEALQQARVDTAFLSITSPGLSFPGVPAAPLARQCNEYAAGLMQSHGRQFRFFTALPMPDVKASIAEAIHSYEQLRASGVGMMTNYDGRYLGDPEFEPLFAELHDRRAIVHVHPTDTPRYGQLIPGISFPVLEFAAETGRTITSLLWAGVFSRYPDIKFIFSHGGGITPMVYSRIVGIGSYRPELAAKVPDGPQAALSRLYADTASLLSRPDFTAAGTWMAADHRLHGSDYPWTAPEATVNAVREFARGEALQRQILGENALRLFPELLHNT